MRARQRPNLANEIFYRVHVRIMRISTNETDVSALGEWNGRPLHRRSIGKNNNIGDRKLCLDGNLFGVGDHNGAIYFSKHLQLLILEMFGLYSGNRVVEQLRLAEVAQVVKIHVVKDNECPRICCSKSIEVICDPSGAKGKDDVPVGARHYVLHTAEKRA